MAGLKGSKTGSKLVISDLNNRLPSVADTSYNFFSRCSDIHGYIFSDVTTNQTVDDQPALYVGPTGREIALQVIGTATLTVKGSLDGVTFVNATTVITSDGFVRISHFYRFLRFGLSGVSGTASLYMAIS